MSLSSVPYEHITAGLSGGFVSTLVVHPFDLLKIRFAVNEGKGALRPQYGSYATAISSIVKQRGFSGLYQGAVPNLVGNTLAWGFYFHFYNLCKSFMRKKPDEVLSAPHHLLAGVISGVATLSLTNPVWVVKTQLCLQYEQKARPYKGFVDALTKVYRAEGFAGWYRGFLPGVIGTSHGAIQFMAYEELRKMYCRYTEIPISQKLGSTEYLTFAAISKVFAVSATYPYQVVRARLQDQHVQYNGALDVIRKTWAGEGFRGFYKGMLASLLRVTPATCITFLVYEHMSQFLAGRRKQHL